MIRASALPAPGSDSGVLDDLPDFAAWTNPKASQTARRASRARNVSKRRRLVDPATCERDYSPAELEFMTAMQAYKNSSGRMFPTWSEVLEVLQGLGYRKP
jgi:hypothetical protein